MGSCFSSEGDDSEARKRTAVIDRKIEDDARKLKRECKILLLGNLQSEEMKGGLEANLLNRFRGKWKVNYRQADENYSPERIHHR